MSAPLRLSFVTSATTLKQLPDDDVDEIAVVGRSNVGKSSLINALANRVGLAKVSKTPGRTQLINYFAVESGGAIVDLPGYGYAKVPERIRASWQAMIENYLLERRQLQRILVLVDGEIGPTKLDVQLLDWLRSHHMPFEIVATKHDKVKSSKLAGRKVDLARKCAVDPTAVVWVSASRNVGVERLRGLLLGWLGVSK